MANLMSLSACIMMFSLTLVSVDAVALSLLGQNRFFVESDIAQPVTSFERIAKRAAVVDQPAAASRVFRSADNLVQPAASSRIVRDIDDAARSLSSFDRIARDVDVVDLTGPSRVYRSVDAVVQPPESFARVVRSADVLEQQPQVLRVVRNVDPISQPPTSYTRIARNVDDAFAPTSFERVARSVNVVEQPVASSFDRISRSVADDDSFIIDNVERSDAAAFQSDSVSRIFMKRSADDFNDHDLFKPIGLVKRDAHLEHAVASDVAPAVGVSTGNVLQKRNIIDELIGGFGRRGAVYEANLEHRIRDLEREEAFLVEELAIRGRGGHLGGLHGGGFGGIHGGRLGGPYGVGLGFRDDLLHRF